MSMISISDIGFQTVKTLDYDVGFFACGYEERCTFIPNKLSACNIKKVHVIGFSEITEDPQRSSNEKFFIKRYGHVIVSSSYNDDTLIYDKLSKFVSKDGIVKIIVDYSSMSRLWYSAVLNWCRYNAGHTKVIVDLVYAGSKIHSYDNSMVIKDWDILPGCEGRVTSDLPSILILGLGLYGNASLCILDRLESDSIYTFISHPGISRTYRKKIYELNDILLDYHKQKLNFELPLTSVENSYSCLAELVSPYLSNSSITIIPMGPKPHVLASILLSINFPEVGCMRVNADRRFSETVLPSGKIVATRVTNFRTPDLVEFAL
jgi:hypothetical protein